MAISELADWWDTQKRESESILGDWVSENPQWWAIGVATAASTAMELGAGLVDTLRLGTGVAQGGLKGVGTDALRLLAVAGPLAEGGAMFARFIHLRGLQLAVATADVTGPCTFTAVNNAMSIVAATGRNLFVTARQAALALGTPLSSLSRTSGLYQLAAWIDELVPFLARQGVRVRNLGIPKTIDEVASAARRHDGVVIFAVEWTDLTGQLQRHSLIAVRTLQGVKFADYGGKFMSSLSELSSRGGIWATRGAYSIAAAGGKGGAILVQGMELIGRLERYGREVMQGGMLLLEGAHAISTPQGVDVALPVTPVAAIERGVHEPEVIKASFENFKARKQGRALGVQRIPLQGRRHTVPQAELLTGVQYRLNALGFGAGPVDGIAGPRTERAVRTFQAAHALKADAIPGPATQKKLREICGF